MRSITFPHIGNGIRRNAETGVEIHTDGGGWYTVVVPTLLADSRYLCFSSLKEARAEAIEQAVMMRETIADAFDLAAVEDVPVIEPVAGMIVEFRPSFSAALKGVRFEVEPRDGEPLVGTDAGTGRAFVRLKTVDRKRTGYRLAWVDTLLVSAAR